MSHSICSVIFDFDGLIIDSETPLFDIWASIYASHGATLTMDRWQHALGTQGGFDPFEHLSTTLAKTAGPGHPRHVRAR